MRVGVCVWGGGISSPHRKYVCMCYCLLQPCPAASCAQGIKMGLDCLLKKLIGGGQKADGGSSSLEIEKTPDLSMAPHVYCLHEPLHALQPVPPLTHATACAPLYMRYSLCPPYTGYSLHPLYMRYSLLPTSTRYSMHTSLHALQLSPPLPTPLPAPLFNTPQPATPFTHPTTPLQHATACAHLTHSACDPLHHATASPP